MMMLFVCVDSVIVVLLVVLLLVMCVGLVCVVLVVVVVSGPAMAQALESGDHMVAVMDGGYLRDLVEI